MRRGEVYLVDFGSGVGREPVGVLPTVVVTTDNHNAGGLPVGVVPGSVAPEYATLRSLGIRVTAAECGTPADVTFVGFLLRTVDRSRVIGDPLGRLPAAVMAELDHILRGLFDLHTDRNTTDP